MKEPIPQTADAIEPAVDVPEFSLIAGGPVFRRLRHMSLSDDGTKGLGRGVILIPLIAWLPLLLLSMVGGRGLGGSGVTFLGDLEVHVRLLVALPLLLLAEIAVERRLRPLPQEFLERNLVPAASQAQFKASIRSVSKLCSSPLVEIILLFFVYGVGILIVWRQYVSVEVDSWYLSVSAAGSQLTLAGIWYGCVSLALFQFILCRWYFRMFVWSRFLWQVSRIDLSLVPAHPDRVGGLGFVASKANAFLVLAAAHGALLAGTLSTRVVLLGTSLLEFKAEIAIMVVFVLCLILGPLLWFSPQLSKLRRQGGRDYGVLAERYARGFEAKWLGRGESRTAEQLVGTPDIQSLADLSTVYGTVRTARVTLLTREAILRLAAATLLPLLPLLLTLMSPAELLKKLAGMLFK